MSHIIVDIVAKGCGRILLLHCTAPADETVIKLIRRSSQGAIMSLLSFPSKSNMGDDFIDWLQANSKNGKWLPIL